MEDLEKKENFLDTPSPESSQHIAQNDVSFSNSKILEGQSGQPKEAPKVRDISSFKV